MSDDIDDEMVLVLHAKDASLKQDLLTLFPEGDISEADNFIGGIEFSAFFKASKEVIGKVLELVNKRRKELNSAKLVIGKDKLELTGVSEEGLQKFLENPVLQKHIARIGKK